MSNMPHAWDIGFPDAAMHDGHPDILTESDDYGRGIPRGWFVCTAFDTRGMALMVKVSRWVHDAPGQCMMLLKTPHTALPYEYGTVMVDLDWSEDFHHYRLLRPRFTHPSREYVLEVARQIATGKRWVFDWGYARTFAGGKLRGNGWGYTPPQWVRVWEHRMDGTWEMIAELLST
jgi:hypothetical protein